MAAPPITGDARFFARSGPHGIAAVARAAGMAAEALAALPEGEVFTGVAPLQTATSREVSFLDNRRYLPALAETKAGAVILHPDLAARVPAGTRALPTPEPYLGWARVAALFHPAPPASPGIHPMAFVHPEAVVDASAEIGPFCAIGARAEIGPRCRLAPGAVIGDGVVMGADCRVGANASISHALLGARVYIYPGARIGQDGFGFATGPQGFVTVPQLGRVIIGDDVEVGANTAIDRGSAQDTVIGAGSRLDNMVQIGHNVRMGRCCVIVAQAGLSGSVTLEDFVVIAAQAGIAGHFRVGAKSRIGAQAGVMTDVPAGADWIGSPAQPVRETFRQIAMLKRLGKARPADRPNASASGTGPERQADPD